MRSQSREESAVLAPTKGGEILAEHRGSPNGNSRPVAAGQRPAGAVQRELSVRTNRTRICTDLADFRGYGGMFFGPDQRSLSSALIRQIRVLFFDGKSLPLRSGGSLTRGYW